MLRGRISGGFFVFNREIFARLRRRRALVFEQAPLAGTGARRRADGLPARRLLAPDGQQPRLPAPQRPVGQRPGAVGRGRVLAAGGVNRTTRRQHPDRPMRTTMARQGRAFWQDRRVFVTGCTGLVGAWTVRALLERGAHVVGLVRDQVPARSWSAAGWLAQIDVVRGCVEDETLARAGPGRVRDPDGLPPGRPDHRRHRQPQPAVDVRDQHQGNLVPARGGAALRHESARRRRLLGQGVRRPGRPALHRGRAACRAGTPTTPASRARTSWR